MSATSLFVRRFRFEPQVTAQASGRVNLLGEHTDYNDGFVLPTALGLRTEVAVARSRDDRFRFTSENLSGDDATVEYRAGETPPAGFGRYVQGCIEVLRERGAEIPPIVVAVHSNQPAPC